MGSGNWWSRELGYTRVRDVWGVALKTASGNYGNDEHDDETIYLFKDAPRWMRLEAVASIPDLLEALLNTTRETIDRAKKATTRLTEFATAMASAIGVDW